MEMAKYYDVWRSEKNYKKETEFLGYLSDCSQS